MDEKKKQKHCALFFVLFIAHPITHVQRSHCLIDCALFLLSSPFWARFTPYSPSFWLHHCEPFHTTLSLSLSCRELSALFYSSSRWLEKEVVSPLAHFWKMDREECRRTHCKIKQSPHPFALLHRVASGGLSLTRCNINLLSHRLSCPEIIKVNLTVFSDGT